MSYVFGINIPLLEIMLVFLVLLGMGLILILIELKKLRQLLTEEKGVIREFESDLARLEEDEGKTANDRLNAYIQDALSRGISKDQIEDVLEKRGWSKDKIDKLLGGEADKADKADSKPSAPAKAAAPSKPTDKK